VGRGRAQSSPVVAFQKPTSPRHPIAAHEAPREGGRASRGSAGVRWPKCDLSIEFSDVVELSDDVPYVTLHEYWQDVKTLLLCQSLCISDVEDLG